MSEGTVVRLLYVAFEKVFLEEVMPKVYLVRYAGVSRRKIQTGLLEGLRQAQSHLMEQGVVMHHAQCGYAGEKEKGISGTLWAMAGILGSVL